MKMTSFLVPMTVLVAVGAGVVSGASDSFPEARAHDRTPAACAGLPSFAELGSVLEDVVHGDTNGGAGNEMWGAVVDRDGVVCAVGNGDARAGVMIRWRVARRRGSLFVELSGCLSSHGGPSRGVLYIAPLRPCQPGKVDVNQRVMGRWRLVPPLRSICSAAPEGAAWLILVNSCSAMATNACAVAEPGAA